MRGTQWGRHNGKQLQAVLQAVSVSEISEDGVGGKFGEDALYATRLNVEVEKSRALRVTEDYSDEPILGALSEIQEIEDRILFSAAKKTISACEHVMAMAISGARTCYFYGERVQKGETHLQFSWLAFQLCFKVWAKDHHQTRGPILSWRDMVTNRLT